MVLYMARITLTIDDRILRELKKKAAAEGRTLQSVTSDLLRRSLLAPPQETCQLRLHGWKATEQPGVDLFDRDALFNFMDGLSISKIPFTQSQNRPIPESLNGQMTR